MKKNVSKNEQALYEIRIGFKLDRDLNPLVVRELLELKLGLTDFAELQIQDQFIVLFYRYDLHEANLLIRRIKQIRLDNVDIRKSKLKPRDWQTKWKDDFKPFHLTNTFEVIPIWLKDSHKSLKHQPIYIDTALAFGTGLHPTTRFMAQFIEKKKNKLNRFLDIGAGTGILSIIAEKCGAQLLTAVEICDSAVKVADKNFKDNGVNRVELICQDLQALKIKQRFDYVAANLVTDDLISNKHKIYSFVKTGGYLAVSGISFSNFKRFRIMFEDRLSLRCLQIKKEEGWTALLYKRMN